MSDAALQVAAARLAVLPFESLSDDAADAYLARGLVEDLIVELSRFPTLEVLHPDSSSGAADGGADLEALEVTFHLCGSVRRSGEVVRLSEVKGFADLSHLLARPGEDVHCLDLAGRQLESHGADVVFDERARRELRARVRDLEEQIEKATAGTPLLYMVNCAHPTHLAPVLAQARAENADWLRRFKGIRANSSRMTHAELDESPELDRGNPAELGREVAGLQRDYDLCVIGGCCGTDAEHVAEIAAASGRRGAPARRSRMA